MIAGVEVSLDEIEHMVNMVVQENMEPILDQRYRINGITVNYYYIIELGKTLYW